MHLEVSTVAHTPCSLLGVPAPGPNLSHLKICKHRQQGKSLPHHGGIRGQEMGTKTWRRPTGFVIDPSSQASSLWVTPTAEGSPLLRSNGILWPQAQKGRDPKYPLDGWTYPRSSHLQVEGSAGQCEAVEEGLSGHSCRRVVPIGSPTPTPTLGGCPGVPLPVPGPSLGVALLSHSRAHLLQPLDRTATLQVQEAEAKMM